METKKNYFDKSIALIQVLALIISGCWIFFKYISHDKIQSQLTNENLKIQRDNLKLQNTLHAQMDNYTVLISKFELEKAKQDSTLKEVDIKYRERMAFSELQSKKLNNESQLISLKYAEELAKLNAEHNIVQNKRENLAYERDIDNRFDAVTSFNCKLIDSVNKIYVGNLKCGIKNISEKSFIITGVVINIYTSKFNLGQSANLETSINTISYPPLIYDGDEIEPLTQWKLIEQRYFLSWNCTNEFKEVFKNDLLPTAKLTVPALYVGTIKSGIRGEGNYRFYFKSNADDIVGISAGIFFDNKLTNGYSFRSYKILKYLESVPDTF